MIRWELVREKISVTGEEVTPADGVVGLTVTMLPGTPCATADWLALITNGIRVLLR